MTTEEWEDQLKGQLTVPADCERTLGMYDPKTATSCNNIGGTYNSVREYPKALEYHLKALPVCERVLGTDHPDTVISYNRIGAIYEFMGNSSKAQEYFQKAAAARGEGYKKQQ
ncbi:MAG: tetratricopeptide repeat protein [Tannerella sp.]|jgi:tetratricopeptide (TPR) repeat protein|nr:tetratricopeptide repeat protein [Tannerella sp.]